MWIRNQTGTALIDAATVYVTKNATVMGDTVSGINGIILGKYDTKDRAMEGLYNITNHIDSGTCKIFRMPER